MIVGSSGVTTGRLVANRQQIGLCWDEFGMYALCYHSVL